MFDIIDENRETLRRIRLDVANDVLERIRRKIVELDLISYIPNKLHLKDSWRIEEREDEVIVGSIVKWAWNMEFGRLPGSPVPIEPLVQWLIYKFKMVEAEARRVAYVVAEKIEREGIKPRRYIRAVLEEMEGETR